METTGRVNRIGLALAACMALLGAAADAHEAKESSGAGQKEATAPAQGRAASRATRDSRTYFTDLELLTHEGRKVRFYSDVLAGRTVLINVMYTNCKDACPLITQQLNQVRGMLGERFGRDIVFVSLSSDPERDSPAALRGFAEAQNADLSGWIFLTGAKPNVDHILKKLGQFSANPEDHSTLLIAGNVPARRWAKIRPDSPPFAIAERLKRLADAGAPAAR